MSIQALRAGGNRFPKAPPPKENTQGHSWISKDLFYSLVWRRRAVDPEPRLPAERPPPSLETWTETRYIKGSYARPRGTSLRWSSVFMTHSVFVCVIKTQIYLHAWQKSSDWLEVKGQMDVWIPRATHWNSVKTSRGETSSPLQRDDLADGDVFGSVIQWFLWYGGALQLISIEMLYIYIYIYIYIFIYTTVQKFGVT